MAGEGPSYETDCATDWHQASSKKIANTAEVSPFVLTHGLRASKFLGDFNGSSTTSRGCNSNRCCFRTNTLALFLGARQVIWGRIATSMRSTGQLPRSFQRPGTQLANAESTDFRTLRQCAKKGCPNNSHSGDKTLADRIENVGGGARLQTFARPV